MKVTGLNSLKTIFSRITTMDEAINSLESIGVAVETGNGSMRNVEDILSDLSSKWSALNNAQRQNLAVTLAGRFQVSR